MMKKLLLLTFLLSQLIGFSQIPGIAYYNGYPFQPWDNGTEIEWEMTECSLSNLQIEFEQEDNYSIVFHGNIQEWDFNINAWNKTLDISHESWGGWYDYNSDYLEVRGENQGKICEIKLILRPNEADRVEVSQSHNKISNDTLFLCSDFGHTDITLDFHSNFAFGAENQALVNSNAYSSGNIIVVNGKQHTGKTLQELNLKTGDTIAFAFQWGHVDLITGCYLQINGDIGTNNYILNVAESPIKNIASVSNGKETMCPGDTITLKKTISDKSHYAWYKGSYNSNPSYYSSSDSINVLKPEKYFLAERSTYKGACPELSKEYDVKFDEKCSMVVQGYVYTFLPNVSTGVRVPGVMVKDNHGNVTTTDENGNFEFVLNPINETHLGGYYAVNLAETDIYKYDSEYIHLHRQTSDTVNIGSLRINKIQQKDLSVSVLSGRNRPGFTIAQYVLVKNEGKDTLTTSASLTIDDKLTYIEKDDENTPSSINGNTFTWNNITLVPGDQKYLKIYSILDRTTPLGTILNGSAYLTQSPMDNIASNDTAFYIAEVTGSYDPNDKAVSYIGGNLNDNAHDTCTYEYKIRFQNTGTDTAFTVRITDVISSNLDLSTINMLDASNNYIMGIKGDTVTWTFNNILLPDSNINEPASHGFLRFQIKQKKDNPKGTEIKNTAYIYFDFNDPIITNTVTSIVNNDFDVDPLITSAIAVESKVVGTYPNPVNNTLFINGVQQGNIKVFNHLGQNVLNTVVKGSVNVSSLSKGLYYFELISNGERSTGRFLKN